jgi:Na+-translocating ferredoxin:NAD+ oxidoreductase RnfD subunit
MNWTERFQKIDPRIPIAGVLFTYLVLGLTVLGFNRSPWQAITTTLSCCLLEVLLTQIFKKKWVFPLSALITSFSLSFLLNYSHDFFLLFVPLFFAIGSKYIFQFKGRHALNPAMAGISLSLLTVPHLVTAAPAYQWNGIASMSLFIIMLGLIFVIPKVNRHWLVISFLFVYTVQTFLRAMIMKHHLPFETLFLGTLSSPSFFIFTFFMITDPATSPPDKKTQIKVGALLATIDLILHLYQSYYTFFYAALIVGLSRWFLNHIKESQSLGVLPYLKSRFWDSKYYLKPLTLLIIGFSGTWVYGNIIHPKLPKQNLTWQLQKLDNKETGLSAELSTDLYSQVDARVQHIVKWVLSVGESGSVADINNDGLPDLFLSHFMKNPNDRATLYLNTGEHQFSKVPLPLLDSIRLNPKEKGIITQGLFADYDNDGDQDLLLTLGFGELVLLKNKIKETGQLSFIDVTREVGLNVYNNSLGATWADFNRDGRLDLFVLNVWPDSLPQHPQARSLNLFKLPDPTEEDPSSPFEFMHDSWHMSNNGGVNRLFLQSGDGKFELQDSQKWRIPETRWSLAVTAADFNKDGWTDLYIANDFGPDDLYYNKKGEFFENVKGKLFGSIGRDTYKGMNASAADFDHDNYLSVYISNVHHAFQAEGSLLWKFSPGQEDFYPRLEEVASHRGVLNESRFGWGASATDFDNDGWVDIAQANGMVDDRVDKKFKECPDYWYVNEKIARSPPQIHRYANKWGDIRGYCIYGNDRDRLYLNRGSGQLPQFVDVGKELGMVNMSPSRAMVSADFENRGRRDLLVLHQFVEPSLYRNEELTSESNEWIGFQLESLNPECNRDAFGTVVKIEVQSARGEWSMTAEKQAVSGFSAQSDSRIHFGLGQNAIIKNVQILWCGKFKKVYENLSPNQYHRLRLE